jgi:hypothetical protein
MVGIGEAFPLLADDLDVPESQWFDVDFSHLLPRVTYQDGIGSCASESAVGVLEGIRAAQGLPCVALSPGHLYGRVNGGRDQGSMLSDNLTKITGEGVAPSSLVGHLDWSPRNWPAEAKTEALKYRLDEVFDCPTWSKICSSLQRRFLVSYGILIGSNFSPDENGIIPRFAGRGGGHAMIACGMRRIGGTWHIHTRNSWKDSWGLKGYCFVPQSYFQGSFLDAWAARTALYER